MMVVIFVCRKREIKMEQNTRISGNRAVLDHWFVGRNPKLSEEYNKIRLIEPLIASDMRLFSKEFGMELRKLENSVKTASSIEDKLQRTESVKHIFGEKFDELESFRSFKDNIRYTMIVEHDEIFDKGKKLMEELESNGYILSGFKNHFIGKPVDLDYKGLHIDFITPFGQEIEIQVHSDITFQANRESHKLYEMARSISTPTEEKQQLKERIKAIYANVPDAKGMHDLPYAFELKNKEEKIQEIQESIDLDVDFVSTEMEGRPYVLSYSIHMGNQSILEGYESIFSDGSALLYRYNTMTNESLQTSLDSKGDEIQTIDVERRKTYLPDTLTMVKEIESSHFQWMEQDDLEQAEEVLEIS